MPSYIRKADNPGRLLLLPSGYIAVADETCSDPEPEWIQLGYLVIRPIPGKYDNRPHFWCIEYNIHITEGEAQLGDYEKKNGTACFPLSVKPPAKISLGLWWISGHTPYPDQSDMQVWCLGKYCGWFKMNMAGYQGASSQPARYVASVVVDEAGEVSVSTSGSGSPFPINPS